jgi:hypothetical protein
MASPSEGNELSFERDIKPSFRTKDRWPPTACAPARLPERTGNAQQ